MTPEQYAARAALEKNVTQHLETTGQTVTLGSLQECVLGATQFAHMLGVSREQYMEAVAIEWELWEQYQRAKKALAQKRANKGGK